MQCARMSIHMDRLIAILLTLPFKASTIANIYISSAVHPSVQMVFSYPSRPPVFQLRQANPQDIFRKHQVPSALIPSSQTPLLQPRTQIMSSESPWNESPVLVTRACLFGASYTREPCVPRSIISAQSQRRLSLSNPIPSSVLSKRNQYSPEISHSRERVSTVIPTIYMPAHILPTIPHIKAAIRRNL